MHKTLLLCFIHGFKGGDDTFGGFPEHFRALVSHALPRITVKAVTYPKFETRGDLHECVGRFREWLQNVVIDLEVSASTPSPTIDPSVRTVLVGHSMGGIVAAETLLSILSDNLIPPAPHAPSPSTAAHTNPFPPSDPAGHPQINEPLTFMFPYIQGILAFDTPYLGICPSVVAYGAETHFKTASTAYSTFSEIASVFGYGAASPKSPTPPARPGPHKLIKEPPAYMSAATTEDAAATPVWQRWGKYAMFAGAAGAVAAGGAAVYAKRDQITEGWSWIGSHLEFVGCLMRGEELKTRLDKIVCLREEKGVGFADLVTVLAPKGGTSQAASGTGGILEITAGEERTFCTLPKREKNKICFEKTANGKASDEMLAHMTMFFPRDNPGYYNMSDRAKELVAGWVDEAWYQGSEGMGGDAMMIEDENGGGGVAEVKEGEGLGISGDKGFRGVEQRWKEEEEDMEDVALDGEKPVIVG